MYARSPAASGYKFTPDVLPYVVPYWSLDTEYSLEARVIFKDHLTHVFGEFICLEHHLSNKSNEPGTSLGQAFWTKIRNHGSFHPPQTTPSSPDSMTTTTTKTARPHDYLVAPPSPTNRRSVDVTTKIWTPGLKCQEGCKVGTSQVGPGGKRMIAIWWCVRDHVASESTKPGSGAFGYWEQIATMSY